MEWAGLVSPSTIDRVMQKWKSKKLHGQPAQPFQWMKPLPPITLVMLEGRYEYIYLEGEDARAHTGTLQKGTDRERELVWEGWGTIVGGKRDSVVLRPVLCMRMGPIQNVEISQCIHAHGR